MKSTAAIFRKHNFLIIDSIMNDGTLSIEGKMFTNPFDKNFDKPIKSISHQKRKINGSNSQSIGRSN